MGDETDGKSTDFTGQEAQEARQTTPTTRFPLFVVENVNSTVVIVRYSDDEEIHSHEPVSQTQVADIDVEIARGFASTHDDPAKQTGKVSYQGKDGEDPKTCSIHTRPEVKNIYVHDNGAIRIHGGQKIAKAFMLYCVQVFQYKEKYQVTLQCITKGYIVIG